MTRLTKLEIVKLVNRYIGVEQGYLGDFSYRTHADFYPEFCNLDINPNDHDGTTRERFIKIITLAEPRDQARILRGVLERFPPDSSDSRSQIHPQVREWIKRLESGAPVQPPNLQTTSEAVERALADTEALIKATGAPSSVDRAHTALHAYMLAVCDKARIVYPDDAGLTQLFKLVRERHAAFSDLGPRPADVTQVLRSFATILDALGPVRNRASGAHPNPVLLPPAEAMLVVNAARTLLHYLDSKLS